MGGGRKKRTPQAQIRKLFEGIKQDGQGRLHRKMTMDGRLRGAEEAIHSDT